MSKASGCGNHDSGNTHNAFERAVVSRCELGFRTSYILTSVSHILSYKYGDTFDLYLGELYIFKWG